MKVKQEEPQALPNNNNKKAALRPASSQSLPSSRADESSGSHLVVQWNKETLVSQWGFAKADLPGIANK